MDIRDRVLCPRPADSDAQPGAIGIPDVSPFHGVRFSWDLVPTPGLVGSDVVSKLEHGDEAGEREVGTHAEGLVRDGPLHQADLHYDVEHCFWSATPDIS